MHRLVANVMDSLRRRLSLTEFFLTNSIYFNRRVFSSNIAQTRRDGCLSIGRVLLSNSRDNRVIEKREQYIKLDK